jgi:hypothetical protein
MGFDITGLGSIFDFGSKVIDKIFPDKTKADEAKAALVTLQANGELAGLQNEFNIAIQQIAVNLQDSKSDKWWQAGWRPFIGWVCGLALFYNYIGMPFLIFLAKIFKPDFPQMPVLDIATLMTLLLGMLGLGAMRSYDKQNSSGKPS